MELQLTAFWWRRHGHSRGENMAEKARICVRFVLAYLGRFVLASEPLREQYFIASLSTAQLFNPASGRPVVPHSLVLEFVPVCRFVRHCQRAVQPRRGSVSVVFDQETFSASDVFERCVSGAKCF